MAEQSYLEALRLSETRLTVVGICDDNSVIAISIVALSIIEVITECPITRLSLFAECLIVSARIVNCNVKHTRARVCRQFTEKSIFEFFLRR